MSKKKHVPNPVKEQMRARIAQAQAIRALPPLPAFTTLDDDVTAGLYRTGASAASIDVSGLEGHFQGYSKGKAIADAVEEAIAQLSCTGSSAAKHSRHDYQPTSSGNQNLQVQLGGSAGDYRRGEGDTSATLVVIDDELFQNLKARNAARLEDVLRAAHRQSYADGGRVTISKPA